MSGWVSTEEQDILESWFAGTALPNTPTHIGLFTAMPTDAGGGTEVPSSNAYARVALARNSTNWGSSAAGTPSSIQNLVAVLFPQATASWGTIVGWGYFTAAFGGSLLYYAELDTSKLISNTDQPRFQAGTLRAELGDPGDTYT